MSELEVDQVLQTRIHRGAKGENGPVVYILSNGTEGRSLRFEESDRQDIMEGKLYLSIYTKTHRAGELRGQILPKEGTNAKTQNP